MVTTEVGFSHSTWEHSRTFNRGLYELGTRMPMELVRLYVFDGLRSPRVHTSCYNRIDELRELRRKAILAEMGSIEAQAERWLRDHPAEAARIAANEGRTVATPAMLLGTAVVNGTSNALGFAPGTYAISPSLRVYELFTWYTEGESYA